VGLAWQLAFVCNLSAALWVAQPLPAVQQGCCPLVLAAPAVWQSGHPVSLAVQQQYGPLAQVEEASLLLPPAGPVALLLGWLSW
jgi:hypothetical protein